MKIGIIGMGSITMDLARRSALSGYEVLISSSWNACALQGISAKIGPNVEMATLNEAAMADIVILFIPKDYLEAVLANLPDMAEKTILHTNNPIFIKESSFIIQKTKSSYHIIKSLLPCAHVVRVFNVMQQENKMKIFIAGKNQQAKSRAKTFLEDLGFLAVDLA